MKVETLVPLDRFENSEQLCLALEPLAEFLNSVALDQDGRCSDEASAYSDYLRELRRGVMASGLVGVSNG